MVETYSGKSTRNARIKIDYTGECPSVKFQYPRKDGYEGSMHGPLTVVWVIFLYIIFFSFTLGAVSEQTILQNNTQINNTQVNDTQASLELAKENLEQRKKDLTNLLLKIPLGFLIIFFPPYLINRLFKKKLNAFFPIYQAWMTKKKYVVFKTKDIKTSKINGKEEIYVEIPYFENIILKYEATKDFSKYLDVMEIREHNFKTEESPKKKKGKKKKNKKVKKQNEWYWYAKFYFNKIPKKGKLSVIYK